MSLLSRRHLAVATAAALLLAAPARAQSDPHHGQTGHGPPATDDSSFAALQRRGKVAMGVDQYTSIHRFDDLADGGRIELQRGSADPAGVRTIREHMRGIAAAFRAGDFTTPAFVHLGEVPGASVMAARREAMRYEVRDLPRGAELRITTRDPVAIQAVHEFMAFQRGEHRAGGVER
jgi:hypothetical protein